MKVLQDDIIFIDYYLKSDVCIIDGIDIFKYTWQNCYAKTFLRYKKLKINDTNIYHISLLDKDVIFGAKQNSEGYDVFRLSEDCLSRVREMQSKYRISLWDVDKIVESYFSFLINEFDFTYVKNDLGDAYNAEGRFFFYGPVYAYSFYNDVICFNILNLVQRQDYDLFVTDSYSTNQMYIRKGDNISGWGMNLRTLASMMKQSLLENGTILGYDITKK